MNRFDGVPATHLPHSGRAANGPVVPARRHYLKCRFSGNEGPTGEGDDLSGGSGFTRCNARAEDAVEMNPQ